jgi:hypothetical protein
MIRQHEIDGGVRRLVTGLAEQLLPLSSVIVIFDSLSCK